MMFFFVFFHRQRSQLEIKTCKRILVTNSSGENYTTSDNNHAHSKTVILHSTVHTQSNAEVNGIFAM